MGDWPGNVSNLLPDRQLIDCFLSDSRGSGTCHSILSETALDKQWDLLQARPGYLLQLEKLDVEARFRELVPEQEKSHASTTWLPTISLV